MHGPRPASACAASEGQLRRRRMTQGRWAMVEQIRWAQSLRLNQLHILPHPTPIASTSTSPPRPAPSHRAHLHPPHPLLPPLLHPLVAKAPRRIQPRKQPAQRLVIEAQRLVLRAAGENGVFCSRGGVCVAVGSANGRGCAGRRGVDLRQKHNLNDSFGRVVNAASRSPLPVRAPLASSNQVFRCGADFGAGEKKNTVAN
ncbi:hypothetical protein DFH08DRAFT_1078302 [Mycena albidolilacea]|uniref:Uncharacterized protein n=1 Tax=Mycena albidolilacea TaxID=1033008 RepID=A0AAD7EV36_9AGAR|nr:hypothetical protein DFH08DRAFT_1078302 [Mycena albidolilacea]